MLGCGLRLNEARELALEDINFEKRVITIRAETSKSGRGRQVRLDPVSAQALSVYIKDWRPTGPSSQIFLAKDGKPLSYLGMHHAFARMRLRFEKLGIKNFQAHRLRHTWATGYHRSGGSLFDLQSEGGWSDLTMVRRYARSTPITELQRRPGACVARGRRRPSGRGVVAPRSLLARPSRLACAPRDLDADVDAIIDHAHLEPGRRKRGCVFLVLRANFAEHTCLAEPRAPSHEHRRRIMMLDVGLEPGRQRSPPFVEGIAPPVHLRWRKASGLEREDDIVLE